MKPQKTQGGGEEMSMPEAKRCHFKEFAHPHKKKGEALARRSVCVSSLFSQ